MSAALQTIYVQLIRATDTLLELQDGASHQPLAQLACSTALKSTLKASHEEVGNLPKCSETPSRLGLQKEMPEGGQILQGHGFLGTLAELLGCTRMGGLQRRIPKTK